MTITQCSITRRLTTQCLVILRSTCAIVALLACLSVGPGAALCAPPAQGDAGRDQIYRLDLSTMQPVPIAAGELKKGSVYYFFSPRLNRRVWSIVQNDGQFWHELGEGTELPARQFDLPFSLTEGLEQLQKINPDLASEIQVTGVGLFMRLGPDQRWTRSGTGLVPLIYDAETLLRWEYRWNQYIPVVHTYGNLWGVRNGLYVPAGQDF